MDTASEKSIKRLMTAVPLVGRVMNPERALSLLTTETSITPIVVVVVTKSK